MKDLIPAFRFLGLGLYIGVCLLGGILGGLWLDNKYDTRPIFILTGLILGLALSGWGVYKMVVPLIKDGITMNSRRERRK